MAGKWHLGEEPEQWPAEKGFERDFTLLQGGGSNWPDMLYPNPAHPHLTFTRNGKLLDKLPKDYFSSAAYSDFIMECLSEHKADDKPFFGYLSFQAVHARWPRRTIGSTNTRVSMPRATTPCGHSGWHGFRNWGSSAKT
jgi:arylsulfatase